MATNVTWTSRGEPIGSPLQLEHFQYNGMTWTDASTYPYDCNNANHWVFPSPGSNPNPSIPTPNVNLPYTSPFPWETQEVDEDGKRIVKAPLPSLELILIEIAKVLREGGDILEIRAIFERHKLKLVDHDGEVIFDPKDIEKLEEKGF